MVRVGRHWGTPFASWVSSFGVPNLARRLQAHGHSVSKYAVYQWVAGRTAPRLTVARTIVEVSGGRVPLDEIYRHAEELRKR